MVIIHLIIPEQRLITIAPKEILGPNILIRKLNLLLRKWSMDRMIIMLHVQFVRIQKRNRDCGDSDAIIRFSMEEY